MLIEQTTYSHAVAPEDIEKGIRMLALPVLQHVSDLIAVARSDRNRREAAGALILIERTIHDARSELDVEE